MPKNNVLPGATNVTIVGSSIQTGNTFNYQTSETRTPARGLGLLFERSALSALVDSNARYDAPKCDEGTRKAIVQRIVNWIESDEDWASALWLHGSAGSGKSALARTIAELCAARKSLLATFFFTRTRTDRITDGNLLIPTLALQIAEKMHIPRRYIKKCLLQDPGIFHKTREVQMRKLIINPLSTYFSLLEYHYKQVIQKAPLRLIVIDGLDECFGKDVQRDLLHVLGQMVEKLRLPIRFLIASRPETQIRDLITDDRVLKADRLVTLNLSDDSNTTSDIRTYLEVQFTRIRNTHKIRSHIPPSWPSAEDITTLVERASGQFIFVSTVVGYVGDPGQNPVTRLTVITERLQPPPADAPYGQLDLLYQLIFSSAEESGKDMIKVLQVLGILIVSRPQGALHDLYITYAGIGRILNIATGDVALLLDEFVSLIELPPLESMLPIRFLHASLADFLLDSSRSGRFCTDMHRIHGVLALHYSEHIPTHISDMNSSTHRDHLMRHFLPFIMHWKNANIPANDDHLCDIMLCISEAMTFLCQCLEPCDNILWTAYYQLLAGDSLTSSLALERNEQITTQRPVIIIITPPPILEGYHFAGSLDTESSSLLNHTRRIGTGGPDGPFVQAVNLGVVSKTIWKGEIILVEIPLASPDRWEVILGWAKRLEQKRINLSGILICQNIVPACNMDWVKLDGKHHDFFSHYQSICPVVLVLMRGPQQGFPAAIEDKRHDLDHIRAWNHAVQGDGTLLWCKHQGTWQTACQILMDVLLENRTWSGKNQQAVDRQKAFSTLREVSLDIQAYAYLDIQFSSIRNAHGIRAKTPPSWPSPEDIAALVERASNQSMYASAVVSYVGSSKHNPVKRLATVIEHLPPLTADGPYSQWYSLYEIVFSSAKESGIDIDKVLQVLGILIVARPQGALDYLYSTYAGIGRVLNIKPSDVFLLLHEFVSLVGVPPLESTLPISILHGSLKDFLLDPWRSSRFFVDMRQIHRLLTLHYSKHIPARISKMTSSAHRDDLKHHFLPFITHWRNAGIPANDAQLCKTILLIPEATLFLCQCLEPCENTLWTTYHELLADNPPTSPLASERYYQIIKQRPFIITIYTHTPILRSHDSLPFTLLKHTRNFGKVGPEGSLVRAVNLGGNSKVVGEGEVIVIDIPLVSHDHSEAVLEWLKRLENKRIKFSGVLFYQNVTSDMDWIQPGGMCHQIFNHCQTLCPIALVLMERSWRPGPAPQGWGVNCLKAWQRAVQVGGTLLWSKYRQTEQSVHQILWDVLSETTTRKQQGKTPPVAGHKHTSLPFKEIGRDKGPIPHEAWKRVLQLQSKPK